MVQPLIEIYALKETTEIVNHKYFIDTKNVQGTAKTIKTT